MNQIMIDLETMSSASNAAIIAIGAVRFDLEKSELGETFYQVINLKSCQRLGMHIDANTVMWWLSQSDAARNAILVEECLPIEAALKKLSEWVRKLSVDGVWGNGADFDNVILGNAYQSMGQITPWSYHQNRCYRTISSLFPNWRRDDFRLGGVAHNALSDAMTQARHLCAMWKEL